MIGIPRLSCSLLLSKSISHFASMVSRAQVVLAGCLITLVLFARFVFFPGAPSEDPGAGSIASDLKKWTFVPAKHANVHSLSRSQCSASFPGLYDRVDIAVSQRERGRKLISYDEVQIAPGRCMLQLLIYENEVRQCPTLRCNTCLYLILALYHRSWRSPRMLCLQRSRAHSSNT